MIMKARDQVDVIEHYVNYDPPFDATGLCKRMLCHAPEKYLAKLGSVVLTNQMGNTASHRRGKVRTRGRKVRKDQIRGYYHGRWQGQEPWIELYVDQIYESMQAAPRWLPMVQELAFADVLFHELGHHIHYEIRPEYREKEEVADDWGGKLFRHYFRSRYWYLVPLLLPVSFIVKLLQKWRLIPHKKDLK